MAIQKNAGSGGNYIREPGEYVVTVHKIEVTKTKKAPPRDMLVVHFQNADEKGIAGYFVKGLGFHEAALVSLKTACGIKPAESAMGLVGKQCGILVEAQEPTEDGKTFMSIVGYGPASEVEAKPGGDFAPPAEPGADDIPF